MKLRNVLLGLVVAASLVGCGETTETTATNEIKELVDNGYIQGASSWGGGEWKAIYEKDQSLMKVVAQMTSKQEKAYGEVDFFDEDYDNKIAKIIYGFKVLSIEDVSSIIPSQDQLNIYLGKTIGDLRDDGFENWGYSFSEEAGYLYEDNGMYQVRVSIENPGQVEDLDDWSVNDMRKLVIESIQYETYGNNILD